MSGRKWLPKNRKSLIAYIRFIVSRLYGTEDPKKIVHLEKKGVTEKGIPLPPLNPSVQALKDRIDIDPKFNMFFNQMFTEVPDEYSMWIHDYEVALHVISFLMTMPPMYTEHHTGCPINAILTFPMGTEEGYAAFLDNDVNEYLKRILTGWKTFLMSKESALFLNTIKPFGWFCEKAMEASHPQHLNEEGILVTENFFDVFVVDTQAEHYGFSSWDAYFTRYLKPNARPVASKDDNKVIVNACESAPYQLRSRVLATDKFWLKTQNYSIIFMLNNDPLAQQFIGGTVYQGFLSNMNYHRYHAPVSGKVVRSYLVEGGYYTECRAMGYDDQGDNRSQGYLTETQTRALVFIESDNAYIGTMCFIAVGMGDVSSCEVTVFEGQRVEKGQEIGTFHIGGSTHCLVFRRGVMVDFDLRGQKPDQSLDSLIIPVNSKIATVPYDSVQ